MRVCLDNNVLIWGLRGVATPGQEDHVPKARQLLEDLDAGGDEILVPTVVVSEFLTAVPDGEHGELLDVLGRRFQLVPFDALAAAKAATLWRAHAVANPNWKEALREEVPGIEHARIKADIQVLATAIVRRAGCLYTHDRGLAKLAEKHLEVRGLPDLRPKQGKLL